MCNGNLTFYFLVGIQIGALGAIAPTRQKDLAELAVSAMLTGMFCLDKVMDHVDCVFILL